MAWLKKSDLEPQPSGTPAKPYVADVPMEKDSTMFKEGPELDPGHADAEDALTEDPGPCPGCGGPGVPLGQLGNRSHFRCRDCGVDFSHEVGR